MSYINDPREMAIHPENGAILEQDNRVESKYQWGAMITDLCDLPVEEYMKPLQVIVLGSGNLPETGTTLYTVKFVIDGETVFTQQLQSGDQIPFQVNAEKEGRNFKGWYYGTTQYSEGSTMPARNLTLTAKYECEVSFVFSIDGNESVVSAYTLAYNSKLTNIPSTIKEGYDFKGWEPSVSEPVTAHTTYVGAFEIKKFTVTWSGYTNGPVSVEYNYGETIEIPESPEKEGYTFKGWSPEVKDIVTANVIYTAKFDINNYKVTFYTDLDGVLTEISSLNKPYNSSLTLPSVPNENGFSFENWVGYNANTNESFNGVYVPAFDLKYVSRKTRNSYVLSYYDNGELIKSEDYLYEAAIILFKYEKEGWTVSEWKNLPETMPYNNVSAHCTSTINQYNVIFKDGNDNTIKEVTVNFGTAISTLVPTVEGYTYTIPEDVLNSTVSEDVTIAGVLTINEYNVSISVNGVIETVKLPYGTNVREYVFEHYSAEEGYSMIVNTNNETVPANGNTMVEITYKANEWTLSYQTTGAEGKNLIGNVKVTFGQPILNQLPEANVEGYDFSGWFSGDTKVTETDTMPNNDLTVTGEFTIKTYTVEIKDGENVILSKSYNHGTKFETVLNDELVQNYITTSFNSGYVVTIDVDSDFIIVNNVVVEVSKTEREFVLTFKNGEEIISSSMTKFGATIVYPVMENKFENGIEYVFIWEDESLNGEPMPLMDVTVVGNYQEKPEAPIYYGSYVVPVSAYSEEKISKYYAESDLNTVYYDSVSVSECEGSGKQIIIFMPGYEPLSGLTDRDANREAIKYYEPPVFIIPISIVDAYNISIIDGAGINNWERYATDNNAININGSDYYFYSHIVNDSLTPYKYDNSDLKVTLKLTKK